MWPKVLKIASPPLPPEISPLISVSVGRTNLLMAAGSLENQQLDLIMVFIYPVNQIKTSRSFKDRRDCVRWAEAFVFKTHLPRTPHQSPPFNPKMQPPLNEMTRLSQRV